MRTGGAEGVAVGIGETGAVAEGVTDGEAAGVTVAVGEGVADAVRDGDGVGVGDAVALGDDDVDGAGVSAAWARLPLNSTALNDTAITEVVANFVKRRWGSIRQSSPMKARNP